MGIERGLRRLGGMMTAGSFFLSILAPFGWAEDGAREALELRYQAELAIAKEQASGHREMARAMQESLSTLLQEYLVTRDGTVALDTVDDIFVQEQFKTARAAEEPGVALALDVFSGPGTGAENKLRTEMTHLADFHSDRSEQAAGRVTDRPLRENEREPLQVTKETVDAYERQMERQLDKIERQLTQTHAAADQTDAKFDAKFEARMDAATAKFAEAGPAAASRVEHLRQKAEIFRELAVETAKSDPVKAELLTEKAEKVEQKAEKTEDRAAKAAEAKAAQDAQRAADQAAAADRAARAAEARAAKDAQDAVDRAAAADRATRAAEAKAAQDAQRAADEAAAEARKKK